MRITKFALSAIVLGVLGPFQGHAIPFDYTDGTDRYITALGGLDPAFIWDCWSDPGSASCVVDSVENEAAYVGGFDLNTMSFFDVYEYQRRAQDSYVGAEQTKIINSLSIAVRVKDDDSAWYDILEEAQVVAGQCTWEFFEVDGDTKTCNMDTFVQSTPYADWYNSAYFGAFTGGVGDFEFDYVRVWGDYTPVASPVPEPGALALLGVGLMGLALFRLRKAH